MSLKKNTLIVLLKFCQANKEVEKQYFLTPRFEITSYIFYRIFLSVILFSIYQEKMFFLKDKPED